MRTPEVRLAAAPCGWSTGGKETQRLWRLEAEPALKTGLSIEMFMWSDSTRTDGPGATA